MNNEIPYPPIQLPKTNIQYVKDWGRIRRGMYLFAGKYNLVFLERDKRPIQRRASKNPPKNTLGKLTVGTASTVRKTKRFKTGLNSPAER